MNSLAWSDHLNQWRKFLEERYFLTEDEGDKLKIERQLTVIEKIKHSAVLNPQLLLEFIQPSQTNENNEDYEFIFDLNDSQKNAVKNALNTTKNISLIQGPPGTGKTQVIAEICTQLYKMNSNVRILVCSETHTAVNNLISRINSADNEIKIVRIRDKELDSDMEGFSPEKIMTSYRDWLQTVTDNKEIIDLLADTDSLFIDKSLEKALALSANIIGMTCNRVGAYRFIDSTEMFDYAIIDEVCKATLPEILMPLSVSERAVLVGDPKQLPPVFCTEDLAVINAIEDCNLQNYMYIDSLFESNQEVMMLDTQYRMENSIGSMISGLFYDGKLKNGRDISIDDSVIWINYSPSREWPEKEAIADKVIIQNLDEVDIIVRKLKELDNPNEKGKSVGVIVPYKHQAAVLRKSIENYSYINVNVDTVDGFQGKECDCIIFGLTRTTGSFRFLADKRRLNVALSRAKDRLIIVGSIEYAKKHSILRKIMELCKIEELS